MCRDGKDNDGDGFTDCLDQDCEGFAFCKDSGAPDRPTPDAPSLEAATPDLPSSDLPAPDLPPPPDLFQTPDKPLSNDAPSSDLPSSDLPTPDLPQKDTTTGDMGPPCKGHHDCKQRWFCYLNTCIRDPKMDVFHCGKPGCPPGHWCVDAVGKKKECKENKAHKCVDACDCGPAHCCKNGICVKDTVDPWKPGGTAIGAACKEGTDATYCCAEPECHAGRFAFGGNASHYFRCYNRAKKKAEQYCGGDSCFGTACACDPGEACVDTTAKTPPGKTCLLLSGGTCASNAVAKMFYGFKSSDLLPCCSKGCLKGTKCDVGWVRAGGRYGYQRAIGTCGSCGNGKCDEGEYPKTCSKDCKCGDGKCDPTEVGKCSKDCGTCGNGKCEPPAENPLSCSKDCPESCGDQWCSNKENFLGTCPKDCGGNRCADANVYPGQHQVCGDGVCDRAGCTDPETCHTCEMDCGVCKWKKMTGGSIWMNTRILEVWGSSASDVFVVGKDGTIMHYDGATWSPMTSGTTKLIWDVWGSSASNVFAVGDHGTILRYNGVKWSNMKPGMYPGLWDVWGSSASDVFVGGNNGVILHYNGATCSTMKSGTTQGILGLWGTSASNVYAAGSKGGIFHYDGAKWSPMASAATKSLWDVWGSSASDIFAVGSSSSIQHYDGVKWSPMMTGTVQDLKAVAGRSATDVFAVGVGAILHYDGVKWGLAAEELRDEVSYTCPSLQGIGAASSKDIFVVGTAGTVLRYCPKGICP